MTTIKTYLEEQCIQHGLRPNEATAVVAAQYDELDDDMKRRWNDKVSDYPLPMMAVLFMGTKRHALAYIDKNKPIHWARPMFV